MNSKKLGLFGGEPTITQPLPHVIWPPAANSEELYSLQAQRQTDISIKGKTGPIAILENTFQAYLRSGNYSRDPKYCISFNSGTSALLAAYFAIGIEPGDEVICPAITYHAAVSPLFFLRAQPILVDVDPQTWTLNPSLIEAEITPKTKAITVVHQWGHPADLAAIIKLAKKYKLKIVEDCSHAHGSTYQGMYVGTFGDVAVFSLQANKIMFAGEGGLLVTPNPEIHDRATILGHYRDRARDEIISPEYQKYWVTGYGLKLRMAPLSAVTAQFSLDTLPDRIAQRHKCLNYLSQLLSDLPEIQVPITKPDCFRGAWYGYKPIYVQENFSNITRTQYLTALQAEGLDVSEPGSPAFSQLPLFQDKDDHMWHHTTKTRVYHQGEFPIAEKLAATALSLPTFTCWPEDKPIIEKYAAAFHKVHHMQTELAQFFDTTNSEKGKN